MFISSVFSRPKNENKMSVFSWPKNKNKISVFSRPKADPIRNPSLTYTAWFFVVQQIVNILNKETKFRVLVRGVGLFFTGPIFFPWRMMFPNYATKISNQRLNYGLPDLHPPLPPKGPFFFRGGRGRVCFSNLKSWIFGVGR